MAPTNCFLLMRYFDTAATITDLQTCGRLSAMPAMSVAPCHLALLVFRFRRPLAAWDSGCCWRGACRQFSSY